MALCRSIATRFAFVLAAMLALVASPLLAQPAPLRTLPPALEATIAKSHEALRKILNGDPSGYAALFADRDDITLGNPFGPFGTGRTAVLAALDNAAKKYTDGSVVRVERVAVYGGSDHYVLVEIEHDRARLGTASEFSEFAARVTSVYEKIGAHWKLVHRHADPITSARTAELMLSDHVPPNPIDSVTNAEANKALVRAFLKALEAGDIAAMNELRGAVGVTHSPNGESRPATTSANLGERCPMCAALPDRKITIDGMVAEGDLVSVRSTWTGTYSGGYRGMEIATPKPVAVRYANTYRIANGKIVENWASYDRLALAEQLGFDLASGNDQAQQQVSPAGIVGTWRLVKFEDVEDGNVIRRFGEKPNGLFVYTDDGHVIIQIANPANPACITPAKHALHGVKSDRLLPSCHAEQFETLLDGTVAYWGTYTVDMVGGVITHNVIADAANGYAGTAQPRPFRLTGDQLILGDGKTSIRVLERVVR